MHVTNSQLIGNFLDSAFICIHARRYPVQEMISTDRGDNENGPDTAGDANGPCYQSQNLPTNEIC